MLLESYEIIGTNLPIYRDKKNDHYTLADIMLDNDNKIDYVLDGYVKCIINPSKVLYQSVFIKKGGE